MTDFYLFISSQDSTDIRKNNVPSDFSIQFPKPYKLEGNWVCALKEIHISLDFKPKSSRLYLCCDLLEDSYVGNTLAPVLRNVEIQSRYKKFKSTEYNDPAYIKVKASFFQSVRFYLRDERLNPVEFTSNDLHCVIRVKKRWVP